MITTETPLATRLVTPDLLLREPLPDDRLAELPGDLDEVRVIVVRSSERVAGIVGFRERRSWIELLPEHRNRGRGTEAMASWLESLLASGRVASVAEVDHPAARAFYRDFGLVPDEAHGLTVSPRTHERLADLHAARERRYRQRVHMGLLELGVPGDYGLRFQLPLVHEAPRLASIGVDVFDRPQFLAPAAAEAWACMLSAAAEDGVRLQSVSAFRGYDDQLRIIERKRAAGQKLSDIVGVSALPGYSEHHSGGAIDVTTPGAEVLEETFEQTDAYRWLCDRAGAFGFAQTYPRDNPQGIAFEPWHWCHEDTAAGLFEGAPGTGSGR